MKAIKTLFLTLVLLCGMQVCGQNQASENRNEFRIGVGVPSIYTNGLYLQRCDCGYMFGHKFQENGYYAGKLQYTPTFEFSYFYRLKSWISVGGTFTYAHVRKNGYLVADNSAAGYESANSFALTPRVRFDWLRTKYVNLYSSIGAGIIVNEIVKGYKSANLARKAYEPWVSAEITPIGIMVGKKLFGYAEVGTGASGWARAGIGYRFGK